MRRGTYLDQVRLGVNPEHVVVGDRKGAIPTVRRQVLLGVRQEPLAPLVVREIVLGTIVLSDVDGVTLERRVAVVIGGAVVAGERQAVLILAYGGRVAPDTVVWSLCSRNVAGRARPPLGERNILAADFEMVVKYECVLRRSHAARGARPDQVHLTVRKLSGLDHRCSEAAEERGVGWFGS